MRRCPSEEGRAQFADAKGGPARMLDHIAAQLASHRLPTVQHLIPVDETNSMGMQTRAVILKRNGKWCDVYVQRLSFFLYFRQSAIPWDKIKPGTWFDCVVDMTGFFDPTRNSNIKPPRVR